MSAENSLPSQMNEDQNPNLVRVESGDDDNGDDDDYYDDDVEVGPYGKRVRKNAMMHSDGTMRVECGHQISLMNSESVSSEPEFVYDPAKVRRSFSHMILLHDLPFEFAEYEMFNNVMRTANPDWEMISQAALIKDCFSSYERQKQMIKHWLNGVKRVSITTELRMSDQKVKHMVVACHFVDSNLTLQKRTLNFVDIPPPHSGLTIADALHTCLVEWGIEKKVWTVTVDNADYNDIVVSHLKEILKYTTKFPLDGKFFHVRCCAHILNILVQDVMSEFSCVIHNVRESVKYIGSSVFHRQIFSDIAQKLNLAKEKLILDCGMRWNVTYDMLMLALEYKDVFLQYQQSDPCYHHLPSEEDWEKVKVVCYFLEEFVLISNVISATDCPTSNLFLPELWNLKKVLDEAVMNDDSCIMAMVMKMKEKFDKYWDDCNLLLSIASVLDPSNKMKFLEYAFKDIYSTVDASARMNDVRDNLYKLFDEYVEADKAMAIERQSQAESYTDSSESVGVRVRKVRPRCKAEFDSWMRNVNIIKEEKSELDIYLEETIILDDSEIDNVFDALEWWREQKLRFPVLSKMACDILSIPTTAVASESVCGIGGRVIEPHYASLDTNTVQMRVCSGDWLRAHYFGSQSKKRDEEEDITKVEYPLP